MDCQNRNLPRYLLPIGTKVFIRFILDFFLVMDTGLETKHQFKYCTYLMKSLKRKKYVLCFFGGGTRKNNDHHQFRRFLHCNAFKMVEIIVHIRIFEIRLS